jgi:hypothetical protein
MLGVALRRGPRRTPIGAQNIVIPAVHLRDIDVIELLRINRLIAAT